jgi:hypothetical protein
MRWSVEYAYRVPISRQSAILERETGIELSRATMDGWVMRVGELLTPQETAVIKLARLFLNFKVSV